MSILGYTGPLGAGKTMSAVGEALARVRDAGATSLVVSNILVGVPEPHLYYQVALAPKWPEELARLCYGVARTGTYMGRPVGYVVILLDEAGLLMWARDWRSFPPPLLWLVSQSRKLRVDVIWTAQFLGQVDATLREITDRIIDVRCFPAASFARRRRGLRPWVLYARTYEGASAFRKRGRGSMMAVHRYPRQLEAVYDTDAVVVPPSFLADGGFADGLDAAKFGRESRQAVPDEAGGHPAKAGA